MRRSGLCPVDAPSAMADAPRVSGTGIVVLIALVGFAAGVAGAARVAPAPAAGAPGALVQWVSRLVAGAALATFALDIYALVKRQSGNDLPTDPVELADGLTRALYDGGVLFSLAAGLAVLGSLLRAKDAPAADPE